MSNLEVRAQKREDGEKRHGSPRARGEPVTEVTMQPRPTQASFRAGLGCSQGLVLETPEKAL